MLRKVVKAGRFHDTLIEVVQVIEEDEPDVQPAQGEEKGEEEQTKPDTVALQRSRREAHSGSPLLSQRPQRMAAQGGSLPGVGLLCSVGRGRFSSWGEKAPSPQLPLSTLGLLIPSKQPLPWTYAPTPISTPPCWFASSLWGISSSGSYTGSGGSGPIRSSSQGTQPWRGPGGRDTLLLGTLAEGRSQPPSQCI